MSIFNVISTVSGSGGSGGNPFDQSLNTTDSPSLTALTLGVATAPTRQLTINGNSNQYLSFNQNEAETYVIGSEPGSKELLFYNPTNTTYTFYADTNDDFHIERNLTLADLTISGALTQSANSGTVSPVLKITGAAHTNLTASGEYSDININLGQTKQFNGGNITTQRSIIVTPPTYAFTSASNIGTSITMDVGTASPGANATISSGIGIRVYSNTPSGIPLLVRANANQVNDIVRFESSTGANSGATVIDSVGDIILKTNPTFSCRGGAGQKRELLYYNSSSENLNIYTNGTSKLLLNSGNTTNHVMYGGLTFSPSAGSASTYSSLTFTGAAHTDLTAATEASDINFNLSRTVQFASGNITTQRAMLIQPPTYSFVGAGTITNACTVDITGGPLAGTNATLTNRHALRVNAGNAVNIPLTIQLAGSQSANAFQVLQNGGNAAAYISSTGGLYLRHNSAVKFNTGSVANTIFLISDAIQQSYVGIYYGMGLGFAVTNSSTTSVGISCQTAGALQITTGSGTGLGKLERLVLAAGAATAGYAPLKFTSGTNLTTAEVGVMEYNGTNLFFTREGTTRESVVCVNAVNSVSPTAPDRTLTVVIDGTTYYIHAKTTNN